MTISISNPPTWLINNGWREIFARIFAEVDTKLNVSPEWLINPATRRHLKLDMLYPALGVAVRFEGAEVKQRRRLSLEEEAQLQVRTDARVDVCREHGIELILVELAGDNPRVVFQEIDLALSRASQYVKKADLRQQISRARTTAAGLARQIQSYGSFKLYADLWEDRQYQTPSPVLAAAPANAAKFTFTAGMEVEHTTFGPGVITAITPSGSDTLLTVDFVTAGQRNLAASLVGDKLRLR